MRTTRLLLAAGLLGSLVACSEKPAAEYHLTAQQLTWQPYKVGDVLRFGQARTSKVRTFAVVALDDELVTASTTGLNSLTTDPDRLEQLLVSLNRTDTVRYYPTPTSTPTRPDSAVGTAPITSLSMALDNASGSGPVYLRTALAWDASFGNFLPIEQVAAGQALPDTTSHLLPTLQLGGISYGPVLQVSNGMTRAAPRQKLARRLYYAKGYGVVGFVEGRTLWYRLP